MSFNDTCRFFSANPSLGVFEHKPIFGALTSPFDYSKDLRDELAKTLNDWSHDKLPDLMSWIEDALIRKFKNSALYIHWFFSLSFFDDCV